jgi:hypothetical protein
VHGRTPRPGGSGSVRRPPYGPRAVSVTELTVEIVVLCVFCAEPLEHSEDVWCPDCECEEDLDEVDPPAERRLAA